jgi:hypothetical protein
MIILYAPYLAAVFAGLAIVAIGSEIWPFKGELL